MLLLFLISEIIVNICTLCGIFWIEILKEEYGLKPDEETKTDY